MTGPPGKAIAPVGSRGESTGPDSTKDAFSIVDPAAGFNAPPPAWETNCAHRTEYEPTSTAAPCPVCGYGAIGCMRILRGAICTRLRNPGWLWSCARITGWHHPDAQGIDADLRSRVYRRLAALAPLEWRHRKKLLARGLTGDMIDTLGCFSWPSKQAEKALLAALLLQEFVDQVETVPGIYRDDSGDLTLGTFGGVAFPVADAFGRVRAVQVDPDDRRPDVGKYLVASSAARGGSSPGGPVAVVPPLAPKPGSRRFWIVEGVLKAALVAEVTGEWAIGVMGVRATQGAIGTARELKKRGFNHACLAVDMNRENPDVAAGIERLGRSLAGFCHVTVASWDPSHMGPDDAIRGGDWPPTETLFDSWRAARPRTSEPTPQASSEAPRTASDPLTLSVIFPYPRAPVEEVLPGGQRRTLKAFFTPPLVCPDTLIEWAKEHDGRKPDVQPLKPDEDRPWPLITDFRSCWRGIGILGARRDTWRTESAKLPCQSWTCPACSFWRAGSQVALLLDRVERNSGLCWVTTHDFRSEDLAKVYFKDVLRQRARRKAAEYAWVRRAIAGTDEHVTVSIVASADLAGDTAETWRQLQGLATAREWLLNAWRLPGIAKTQGKRGDWCLGPHELPKSLVCLGSPEPEDILKADEAFEAATGVRSDAIREVPEIEGESRESTARFLKACLQEATFKRQSQRPKRRTWERPEDRGLESGAD